MISNIIYYLLFKWSEINKMYLINKRILNKYLQILIYSNIDNDLISKFVFKCIFKTKHLSQF
jgi:hypothetical protein